MHAPRYPLIILLLTTALMIPLSALADDSRSEKTPAVSRLGVLSGEKFESEFLSLMINHHQGAIEMAKLVHSQSERPELHRFAENMISNQSREIEQMRGWLKSRTQDSTPHVDDAKAEGKKQSDLAQMKAASGETFETLFLEKMIKHHRDGIQMAELVPHKSEHKELVNFAEKLVEDQGKEIDQMKAWKERWSRP